jgi:hypothetical protein
VHVFSHRAGYLNRRLVPLFRRSRSALAHSAISECCVAVNSNFARARTSRLAARGPCRESGATCEAERIQEIHMTRLAIDPARRFGIAMI